MNETPDWLMDMEDITTGALVAERDRLTTMRAWGHRLNAVNAELHRREPVELAQDSYYYGSAADFRRVS